MLVMVEIFLLTFLANSAYSSFAFFQPLQAAQKGLDAEKLYISVFFYIVYSCFLSPGSAALMNHFGRKRVLLQGCLSEVSFIFTSFLQTLACLGLALSDFSSDPYTFSFLNILCLLAASFGFCCISSAATAVIFSVSGNKKITLMCLQQCFAGLGMLVGPYLHAFFGKLGSYQGYFYVCALAFLLLRVLLTKAVKEDKTDADSIADDKEIDMKLELFDN